MAGDCADCKQLKTDVARLKGEIERLKDVLHLDRSGLADGLQRVKEIAGGWRWATEGRGSYAWNDDGYHKEMGRLIDAVCKEAYQRLVDSGNLAHAECCASRQKRTVPGFDPGWDANGGVPVDD